MKWEVTMLKIMICCFRNLIINLGRSRVTGLIEDLIYYFPKTDWFVWMNLSCDRLAEEGSHYHHPILPVALVVLWCAVVVESMPCRKPTQQNALRVLFFKSFFWNGHKKWWCSCFTDVLVLLLERKKWETNIFLFVLTVFAVRYFTSSKNKAACVLFCWLRYHSHRPAEQSATTRTNRHNLPHYYLVITKSTQTHSDWSQTFLRLSYWLFYMPLKLNGVPVSLSDLGKQLQVHINIPPGSGRPALPVPIRPPLLPQIYLSSNIFSSRRRSGTPPAAPTLPLW